MIAELHNDPVIRMKKPSHGNLEGWAKQGVLLLNTCLTVRKGEANSHSQKGWETFTDAVVKQLATKEGIVYLLWGIPAQTKCKGIDASKNHIIKSSHPSPLSATKTNEPFMGSRCFSRCNAALVAAGKDPIDWSIE
jgi:uracil-DNA glycosylase